MACLPLYWGPVPSLQSWLTVWVLNCVPDGEFSQCLNLTFSLVVHCVRLSIIQTQANMDLCGTWFNGQQTSEYCWTLRCATMEGYLSSHFSSLYSRRAEARTSTIVWICYCTNYFPLGLTSVCFSGEERPSVPLDKNCCCWEYESKETALVCFIHCILISQVSDFGVKLKINAQGRDHRQAVVTTVRSAQCFLDCINLQMEAAKSSKSWSMYLSIYLSVNLSVCLSIYLSICLSVCLSTWRHI